MTTKTIKVQRPDGITVTATVSGPNPERVLADAGYVEVTDAALNSPANVSAMVECTGAGDPITPIRATREAVREDIRTLLAQPVIDEDGRALPGHQVTESELDRLARDYVLAADDFEAPSWSGFAMNPALGNDLDAGGFWAEYAEDENGVTFNEHVAQFRG